MWILLITGITVLFTLLLFCCVYIKSGEDRRKEDEEQEEWLRSYGRERKHSEPSSRHDNPDSL